ETEIRHSIDQRTTERIDKLYEDARQESFRKIAEIKQKSKESIAALMELYKQNRSRWESDIVNQIIGQ
ncbi:MAG: hypothetical protein LBS84_07125, partial [Clostridiales bacterium]|nr:hypothetical protein [Clostridiales bacterium]